MFPNRWLVVTVAVAVLCSACSVPGGDDGGSSPETDGGAGEAAASRAPSPPEPATGTEVRGAAYRFVLPADPAYVLFDEYVRSEDGQHGRRWRWSPTGEAPFCYVHAVEQPNYTAEFPQSSIDIFESREGPRDRVMRNEVVDPPPSGASAAVAQEMSSDVTLDDGTPIVLRGVIREQLTPGRTLLQLISSAPEEMLDTCGIVALADSFVPTGSEAPTDPPQPSTLPSPSRSAADA